MVVNQQILTKFSSHAVIGTACRTVAARVEKRKIVAFWNCRQLYIFRKNVDVFIRHRGAGLGNLFFMKSSLPGEQTSIPQRSLSFKLVIMDFPIVEMEDTFQNSHNM